MREEINASRAKTENECLPFEKLSNVICVFTLLFITYICNVLILVKIFCVSFNRCILCCTTKVVRWL